ncbi:hypothetical protein ABZ725_42040 [Streptomyces sp. NPDC006872]|uniref:hypothetical protein n=1 Tax=Streptomyces sp. NPDC006872 TaxID=3155720 RepID=UPI0033D88107
MTEHANMTQKVFLYTTDAVAGMQISTTWGLHFLESFADRAADVIEEFKEYVGQSTEANAVLGVRIEPIATVRNEHIRGMSRHGANAPAHDIVGSSVGYLIYGNPVLLV